MRYSLYADDSAIWTSSADARRAFGTLQLALDRLSQWSRKNGLYFSAHKSATVLFSAHRHPTPATALTINGSDIPYVRSFKFLGLVLDNKLNMNLHIEHLKTKCTKRINVLRALCGQQSGADSVTLIRIYKTLVRPVLEYGVEVYASAPRKTLAKLDTIQNECLRIAAGAYRTTPIKLLQGLTGVTPLHLRRQELSLRYWAKINSVLEHPVCSARDTHSTHDRYQGRVTSTFHTRCQHHLQDLEIEPETLLYRTLPPHPPWSMNTPDVNFLPVNAPVTLPDAEIQQAFRHYAAQTPQCTLLYTDGSRNNASGRTGCAIYVNRCRDSEQLETTSTKRFRLPNWATVYDAELFAIYKDPFTRGSVKF